MKRKLLLIIGLLFSLYVTAQTTKNISGVVKDEKGQPLPGVSVIIKGTQKGTSTSVDGKYALPVATGSTLVFRFIGYEPAEAVVGTSSAINISLKPSGQMLGEVQITGAMGIQKDNKKLGYAVTQVKGEDLTKTNTVSPIAALQGKVAGVNINVTGASGAQSSPFISIRGSKVLGNTPGQANNQPIFVVDGTVLTNNMINADDPDAGSQLKNLNPDDYESVSVLKGAAATSIYGSRGLNGAIVITTKKGKMGSGLGIDFSSTYQGQQMYKAPIEFQNVYGQGSWASREGAFAPDGSQIKTTGSWGPRMDGSIHPIIYDPNRTAPYSPQPDNWKQFYQNGNFINNNIALSGATEKFNYRFSYTNNSTRGNLPNNSISRNSFDMKMGATLNKVFSTEMGINYGNTASKNMYTMGRYAHGSGQNLAFNTYYLPRNIDYGDWYSTYRNPDNSINNSGVFANLSSVINAFSRFDKNNQVRNENSLIGYTQLKAQVTPWLDLSGRINVNFYKIFTENKEMGNEKNNLGGAYSVSGSTNTDYTMLFMAHANKRVMNDDLEVDFRVFNEIYGNRLSESYYAATKGGLSVPNKFFLGNSVFPIYQKDNIQIGDKDAPGPSRPSLKTIGFAGVLNLNYKDYLNLEVSARNDWLSTLTYPETVPEGKNNYSVFYPAVNASYSFYDHMKETMPEWLSSGRLRGSLAYVGNAGVAGPYSTGSGYSPSTLFDQNGNSVGSAVQINGEIMPNYNLFPQRQRSWEFGTNLGVINELVNLDFTWYKTNTLKQLLNLPGVIETGYSKSYFNAGNIQNQGIEFLINVNPIRSNGWNWDFALNLAHNKSKIVSFGNGIKEWELSGGYNGANVYAYVGGDFGILTSDLSSSVLYDQETGLPVLKVGDRKRSDDPLTKHDFAIYYTESPESSDELRRVNIGKVEPDLTGGFSTSLRYKNFSLSSQIDGRFGGYVYSEAYNYAMAQGTLKESLQYRDKEHGGVERIDSYTGEKRYDGVILNGVFAKGEKSNTPGKVGTDIGGMTFQQAYEQGLVEPMRASAYHVYNYGYATNINANNSAAKNSWVMLRDISFGYRLPSELVEKAKLRSARLTLSARNIGYLYRSLPAGQNPESLQGNDPFRPYITGGVPFVRNYSVTLNVSL